MSINFNDIKSRGACLNIKPKFQKKKKKKKKKVKRWHVVSGLKDAQETSTKVKGEYI
jgi:hypothetical protein